MARTTIVTEGSAELASSDIVVVGGSALTIGLFATADRLPIGARALIELKTPTSGQYMGLDALGRDKPAVQVMGPATIRVRRLANDLPFGVFSEL